MENYKVYMHVCPNGKVYIGITMQMVERRWQKGKGYAYGNNPFFYNAIKKYGWENIKHIILFKNMNKKQAELKEVELIKKYKSSNRNFGYNLNKGGNSCGKHSVEYKKKMSKIQKEIWKNDIERRRKQSERMKNRTLSDSTKEKIRQANLGKKQSAELIEKRVKNLRGKKRPDTSTLMSKRIGKLNPNYGKKFSDEHKRKISEKSKLQPKGGDSPTAKKVFQYDKNMNFIKEFPSVVDAQNFLNLKYSHISECCLGKRKTNNGYIWKYRKEGVSSEPPY